MRARLIEQLEGIRRKGVELRALGPGATNLAIGPALIAGQPDASLSSGPHMWHR